MDIIKEQEKANIAIQKIVDSFQKKVKESSKIQWRIAPKKEETYFFIAVEDGSPYVLNTAWCNCAVDKAQHDTYNVFKTKAEAEAFMYFNQYERAVALALAYIHGSDWSTCIDFSKKSKSKYCFAYDHKTKQLVLPNTCCSQIKSTLLYANSLSELSACLEMLSEDVILKSLGIFK